MTSDVSRSLRDLLRLDAMGQTLVLLRVSTRTAIGSVCRAAPIDEYTGIPRSTAPLSSDDLWRIESMASTRTSHPSRIPGTVSSVTRSGTPSISMSGLIDLALSQATSAFGLPTVSTVARIWRLRLLSANVSASTTRILPTPALTSPSSA